MSNIMQFLNPSEFMKYIKKQKELHAIEAYNQRIKEEVFDPYQIDPDEGRVADMIDFNQIDKNILYNNALKTTKLFVMIFSLAFFFGMFFRLVVVLENNLYSEEEKVCEGWGGMFDACYSMNDRTTFNDFIVYVYFAFTTLCTVGFGDFHAKSNLERGIMAF